MKLPETTSYDVIVIGSGMSGLTVASLAAQLRNQRVLVLERHFVPGGFTHTFQRDHKRFRWDVGLHYVGDMQPGSTVRGFFDLVTQRGLTWVPFPHEFEVFHFPGLSVAQPGNPQEYRERLKTLFPNEAAGLDALWRDRERALRWAGLVYMRDFFPRWVVGAMDLFFARARKLSLTTTRQVLDRRLHDPLLKAVLTAQWGDYGTPPGRSAFAAWSGISKHYDNGAWYPAGGAGRIYESIHPLIEKTGGAVLTQTEVTEIVVRNGQAVGVKARHHDRELEFSAPRIVSSAGVRNTYLRLLPPQVPIAFREQLARAPFGFGVAVLHLGLRESPAKLGLKGENHWLYDVPDTEAPYAYGHDLLEGRVHFAFFSLQSLKDPEAQHHTAIVLTYAHYDDFARWADAPWRHRGEEYDQLKQRIADGLLGLVERHFPGFSDLVEYREVSTPLSVEDLMGHPHGQIYGEEYTPERYTAPWHRIRTPVKGLFLTGADATGGGIVGALMGGVMTYANMFGFKAMGQAFSAAKATQKK